MKPVAPFQHPRRPWLPLLALTALVLAAAPVAAPLAQSGDAPEKLMLHRPSPDWRDQVLYFILTDRFNDGQPRNNDQGAGEYDPSRPDRYSGGDLEGIRQRLDYVQKLGATGIWITPPVANQWLNAQGTYSGYHGYWAEHFMKVDPHQGSLRDYRRLSDALHRRGMVLVQDIVVNHTGDFFYYDLAQRRSGDPAAGWKANRGGKPVSAPTQAPFHLNNPQRAADRAAGIYHWTPDVQNYQDRTQELTHQMSGLDDLNTENPRVREALRRSYAHWIREVGVDGFRVDTAFYVPPEYFEDFIWRRPAQGGTPGMAAVAAGTGRRDFLVFGEGFGIDAPGVQTQSRKIESYMHGPKGERRMQGMLNFPLYGALHEVLAQGGPTRVLGERLRQQAALHPRLATMPTFIDNHDVDRFRAGADDTALRQGLALMFTLPGIPVVYYGTEQGFTQQRASMFAKGWGSGGRDHFDENHPLFRHLQSLAQLRKDTVALRRGSLRVLAETTDDAGALVWLRSEGRQRVLVALNTADDAIKLPKLAVGANGRRELRPLWSMGGEAPRLQTHAEGGVDLALPPRSVMVWSWEDDAEPQGEVRTLSRQSERGPWELRLAVDDPAGDDRGPDGRYRYPLDPVYAERRPTDLLGARVYTRREGDGRTEGLQLELTMAGISQSWSPRNGFDHVAFTVFVELPGAPGGSRVMPLQQGLLPGDLRWHRRLRAHGWSLSLFDVDGAGPESEGTPIARGVQVQTDPQRRTVTFTLSSEALGRPQSLSGARIWVNTWDWDGRYRDLAPEPAEYRFGGGSPEGVRTMDTSAVLVLP